jgi:uncharacterized protein YutE (UPF0331/DUF86 family)
VVGLDQAVEQGSADRKTGLNRTRRELKHHDTLPHPLDIEKHRASVTAFLSDNTPTLFGGVEFEAVSLIDLVACEPVRESLRRAEAARAGRDLQEAIEVALDINADLIAETAAPVPDDYYSGFVAMGDLGILSPELARRRAPSAGLRNRLVHEYDTLDDDRVLAASATLLEQYPRYIQAIEAHLGKAGLLEHEKFGLTPVWR